MSLVVFNMIYCLSIIVTVENGGLSLCPKDPDFITGVEKRVFKTEVTLCCGGVGAHTVGAHGGPVSSSSN